MVKLMRNISNGWEKINMDENWLNGFKVLATKN